MQRKRDILRVKQQVRARDGKCMMCGITNADHIAKTGRSLDVHRLIAGSEYVLEHCQALCRVCHNTLPKVRDWQAQQEAIRQAGLEPLPVRHMLLGWTQEDAREILAAARLCGMPSTRFVMLAAVVAAKEGSGEELTDAEAAFRDQLQATA